MRKTRLEKAIENAAAALTSGGFFRYKAAMSFPVLHNRRIIGPVRA